MRHHGEFSVMGTIFNPAVREATSSLPSTIHTSEDRTEKPFPPIVTLEGGLAADRWRKANERLSLGIRNLHIWSVISLLR